MGDSPSAPAPEPSDLQFDRAETRSPKPSAGPACAACKRPLADQYFLAGSAKVCSACKGAYEQRLAAGSKSSRVLKASLLGLLAALVGGGIWAVLIVTTNYMLGIVAVGMGYLVGIAVRKGSEGRGGRSYQVLAMALAYLSIATGFMGVGIAQFAREKNPAAAAAKPQAAKPGEPGQEPARPVDAKAAVGGCAGALGMLLLFYAGAPLLIGKEDPFTFLFLAIALWEAWKLNRGVTIRISGPFKLGGATDAGGAAGG